MSNCCNPATQILLEYMTCRGCESIQVVCQKLDKIPRGMVHGDLESQQKRAHPCAQNIAWRKRHLMCTDSCFLQDSDLCSRVDVLDAIKKHVSSCLFAPQQLVHYLRCIEYSTESGNTGQLADQVIERACTVKQSVERRRQLWTCAERGRHLSLLVLLSLTVSVDRLNLQPSQNQRSVQLVSAHAKNEVALWVSSVTSSTPRCDQL